MGVFRRDEPAPSARRTRHSGFGPVPATTARRVAEIRLTLADVADERAVGVPFLPRGGYLRAVAAVRHYLPDRRERRDVSRETSMELLLMLRIGTIDFDAIDRLLGVTSTAYHHHGIPQTQWQAGEAIAGDAKWIVVDLGAGRGPNLDRWKTDDDYVASSLASQLVVLMRFQAQQREVRRIRGG